MVPLRQGWLSRHRLPFNRMGSSGGQRSLHRNLDFVQCSHNERNSCERAASASVAGIAALCLHLLAPFPATAAKDAAAVVPLKRDFVEEMLLQRLTDRVHEMSDVELAEALEQVLSSQSQPLPPSILQKLSRGPSPAASPATANTTSSLGARQQQDEPPGGAAATPPRDTSAAEQARGSALGTAPSAAEQSTPSLQQLLRQPFAPWQQPPLEQPRVSSDEGEAPRAVPQVQQQQEEGGGREARGVLSRGGQQARRAEGSNGGSEREWLDSAAERVGMLGQRAAPTEAAAPVGEAQAPLAATAAVPEQRDGKRKTGAGTGARATGPEPGAAEQPWGPGRRSGMGGEKAEGGGDGALEEPDLMQQLLRQLSGMASELRGSPPPNGSGQGGGGRGEGEGEVEQGEGGVLGALSRSVMSVAGEAARNPQAGQLAVQGGGTVALGLAVYTLLGRLFPEEGASGIAERSSTADGALDLPPRGGAAAGGGMVTGGVDSSGSLGTSVGHLENGTAHGGDKVEASNGPGGGAAVAQPATGEAPFWSALFRSRGAGGGEGEAERGSGGQAAPAAAAQPRAAKIGGSLGQEQVEFSDGGGEGGSTGEAWSGAQRGAYGEEVGGGWPPPPPPPPPSTHAHPAAEQAGAAGMASGGAVLWRRRDTANAPSTQPAGSAAQQTQGTAQHLEPPTPGAEDAAPLATPIGAFGRTAVPAPRDIDWWRVPKELMGSYAQAEAGDSSSTSVDFSGEPPASSVYNERGDALVEQEVKAAAAGVDFAGRRRARGLLDNAEPPDLDSGPGEQPAGATVSWSWRRFRDRQG